jgi:rubrerythrin
MSTQDNLQVVFAGESQANRKYLAFAAKADAEGHPQIAKLFRAAAAIHVCDVCGNTVVGEAPDKCPVCGALKAKFKEVL